LRWDIEDDKLSLSNVISDPVEAHIEGVAALLFNGISRRLNGLSVDTNYNSRVLWVAHVG
jgi:hypothetical protein